MSNWRRLRSVVYARDDGICQVCLLHVGRVWDLGHLVDRCMGGQDDPSNLVLMCVHCNRRRKPIHRRLDEATSWLRDQQRQARGQPLSVQWEPFYRAMYGRT